METLWHSPYICIKYLILSEYTSYTSINVYNTNDAMVKYVFVKISQQILIIALQFTYAPI